MRMRFCALTVLATLCGCSQSTEPLARPVPQLETIPYGLLGTGKIAFERIAEGYHGVYLIDPVAQTSKIIGSGIFNGPALSPDGEQLAVKAYSQETGSEDVFVHRTDGTDRHKISAYSGTEGVPSWTPDGTAVTFLRRQDATEMAIANVNAASGELLRTTTLKRADACSFLYTGSSEDRVEVSSSGSIATPCGLTSLVILNSDGVKAGSYNTTLPTLIIGFSWSTDGTKLAIMELTGENGQPTSQTLRIVNADGGSPRTVFTVPLNLFMNGRYPGANDSAICWLKGVNRLLVAVLSVNRRDSQLYVVNEDGTGLTRITNRALVTDRSVTCSR